MKNGKKYYKNLSFFDSEFVFFLPQKQINNLFFK